MQRLRSIKLRTGDLTQNKRYGGARDFSNRVLLTRSIITLPWLWHIYQDGFSKEKYTRGSHTHTFSFSV
ncbi:unnamed protein product [Callosobruchus maculatus]|uniref:Uncharacterized protein n=1 Tax=Callosobruchus maculatus TaxID=64391 RepID=A0A653BPI6_CALMS|nr:unnamed protein product [Callosobruchus maculatus]